jgi:hypothetical protein
MGQFAFIDLSPARHGRPFCERSAVSTGVNHNGRLAERPLPPCNKFVTSAKLFAVIVCCSIYALHVHRR